MSERFLRPRCSVCTRFTVCKFYTISNTASSSRITCMLSLKNPDETSSDDTPIELSKPCWQTLSWAFKRPLRRLGRSLLTLHDEINALCARPFVIIIIVDAQFRLYPLAVCYDIHITLAHTNARWIGTIAYRMTYHEMLARCSLIHACSSPVKMSCSDTISCSLWPYACSNMTSICMP